MILRRHREIDPLGVGVVGGRGVRVLDPLHAAVDHRRVGISVELEERRGPSGALPDVAVHHDPAVVVDQARQHEVHVAEPIGERGALQQVPHLDPAGSGVAVGDLLVGVLLGSLVVELAGVGAHDDERRRVVGGPTLPVVHAGFVDEGGLTDGRDVLQGGHRQALGGRLVRQRGDGAEPVGEHEVGVLPRPAPRRDAGLVDLAHREHRHPALVLDRVPVDVDVPELVVRAEALERPVDLLQPLGTPQADVPDRRGVLLDLLRRHLRQDRPLGHLDVPLGRDLERSLGESDVVRDVGALALQLLRIDAEPLDGRRDHRAGDERDEREQPDPDHRQRPVLLPDVREEQKCAHDRDEGQQPERGQLRLDVGVGRTRHHAALRDQQIVGAEVVPPGLHEQDQPEQRRQVSADLRGRLVRERRGLRADPTPQVVGDRRDDRDADQRGEQPSLDELEPGQGEDVEGRVPPEDRVGDPEARVAGVAPQQERLPPGRRRGADE